MKKLSRLHEVEENSCGGLKSESFPHLLGTLLNSSGKPRLESAREMLLKKENLEELGFNSFEDALALGEELFSYWRDFSEFMVMKKEFVGFGDPKPTEYFAEKCSKRGNDVYQRRIKTRFDWLSREMPDKKFFGIKDFQVKKKVWTSLLWITLTYDPSRGDLIFAWETLGEDFNRFVTAMRRRYGRISYFRVWESFESGYPHVHAVMFFEEAKFEVKPYWSEDENKLTFRVEEKDEIAELWHSFVDIQAISSLSNVFTYLKKHQEKIILGLSGSVQEGENPKKGFDLENIKGLRTLFLTWIFRKRSFSVSGDFREKLGDLISHLHNSNMGKQVDLEGNFVSEWKFTFLGIWSAGELGIPPFVWFKRLEQEEVERLLEGRS